MLPFALTVSISPAAASLELLSGSISSGWSSFAELTGGTSSASTGIPPMSFAVVVVEAAALVGAVVAVVAVVAAVACVVAAVVDVVAGGVVTAGISSVSSRGPRISSLS